MDNFNRLGQLTLRCGGNFAGHIYLKYFANKPNYLAKSIETLNEMFNRNFRLRNTVEHLYHHKLKALETNLETYYEFYIYINIKLVMKN